MHETASIPYLREIAIFLAATGLLVPTFHRFKLSPVLGFLIAGMIIGPYGLGETAKSVPVLHRLVISDIEGVRSLAELGIIFLLFTIGLELSFERLWRMRKLVFGLGGGQVIVTGVAIAVIAAALGAGKESAIVLGAAFALSSTAFVMQTLGEQKRLATHLGRTSFGVLLLQDLAVVPILFLVGALAEGSGGSVWIAFALAMLKAAVVVAVIFVLGRIAVRPVFRHVGSARAPELFMAATLLALLGASVATSAAGLSMALGAFLAGLLLSETEYRHQIDVDIAPFKGLLLGLFFMSVGMSIDPAALAADWMRILGATLGIILLKSAITAGLGLLLHEPRAVSLENGILLSQVGEFAFVIAGVALARGILPESTHQFVLIVAGLTMLATPALAILARRLGQLVAKRDATREHAGEFDDLDMENHVIVAGYGRVGSLLASVLDRQNVANVGLDLDAPSVSRHRAAGRNVFYGDASRPEILERAGAARAAALVVTMDHARAVEEITGRVRRTWPQLPIYARARDIEHAQRLVALGATKAVPENLEASLQLAQETLEGVGIPDEAAWRLCDEEREKEFGGRALHREGTRPRAHLKARDS